jgi:hypothetical protein
MPSRTLIQSQHFCCEGPELDIAAMTWLGQYTEEEEEVKTFLYFLVIFVDFWDISLASKGAYSLGFLLYFSRFLYTIRAPLLPKGSIWAVYFLTPTSYEEVLSRTSLSLGATLGHHRDIGWSEAFREIW